MQYAVLDAGQIVAEREIADFASYPEHKRLARDEKGDGGPTLRPIEGDKPAYDPRVETISGPELTIEASRVLRRWTVTPRSLADVKADLCRRVEEHAEAARQRYITPGAGMAMTYAEKKEQAMAVLDLGSDDANALQNNGAAEYPLLAASVGVEAATLYEAAELVMSRYEAWVAVGGAIEVKRLTGKKAVNDAPDAKTALKAYEAISW